MEVNKVVEVQGFYGLNNTFVVKELTIVTGKDKFKTWLFKPPYSFNDLTPKQRRTCNWLTHKFHHLDWNCGTESYDNLIPILKNNLNGSKKVYTRGANKVLFLNDLLGVNIVLKGTYRAGTELLVPKYCCVHHTFTCRNCATFNALKLFNNMQ